MFIESEGKISSLETRDAEATEKSFLGCIAAFHISSEALGPARQGRPVSGCITFASISVQNDVLGD